MTTQNDHLEVSRLIRASQDRVFAAWTDPDLIVRWWGAGGVRCTSAEIELAEGGTYRIANEAPDGTTMWVTGTFSRIDAPLGLAYTWAIEPVEPDTVYSLVEVSFDSVAEGTMVTILHTRIATPDAREIHLRGWIGCLEGLDDLLADGRAGQP